MNLFSASQMFCYIRVLSDRNNRVPSGASQDPSRRPQSGTAYYSRSLHEQTDRPYLRHPGEAFTTPPRSRVSHLSLSVASGSSPDGNSTSDPSPVSPATPRSAVISSAPIDHRFGPAYRLTQKDCQEQDRDYHHHHHHHGRRDTASPYTLHGGDERGIGHAGDSVLRGSDARLSACRHSCEDDSDGDPRHRHDGKFW